jgi:hypothetical protein
MYWGDNKDGFEEKLNEIAALLGKNAKVETAAVDSYLYETQPETRIGRVPKATETLSTIVGGQSLLERSLDKILKPYAKAAVRVGYVFNPEEFAKRFGIPVPLALDVEGAIAPNKYENVSVRSLFEKPEELAGSQAFINAKGNFDASVPELITALESRTLREGVFSTTDYSENAKTFIARVIADEIEGQVERANNKIGLAVPAVGWYGVVVDKMKSTFANSPLTNKLEFFDRSSPKYDPAKEFVFNALIGITSQGNNVLENMKMGLRAGLMYLDGMGFPEIVEKLYGTFGDKTRAIEFNILKLGKLIDNVGIEELIDLLGQKKTVGEWNKFLDGDKRFHFNKIEDEKLTDKIEPLSVTGLKSQLATGYSIFGPKIGSFINNLRGDFSTLTADLWFTRTWNRIIGRSFKYDPVLAAKQYSQLKDLITETFDKDPNDKDLPNEVKGKSKEELDAFLQSSESVKEYAAKLFKVFATGQFKEKSELRRAAKNLTESFKMITAAPRTNSERKFQEETVNLALKMLKRKGINIEVADAQASLWFNEKELFQIFGAAKGAAKQADYSDGAEFALLTMDAGSLFEVTRNEGNKSVDVRLLSPEQEKKITGVTPKENAKKPTATEFLKQKKLTQPDPDVQELVDKNTDEK